MNVHCNQIWKFMFHEFKLSYKAFVEWMVKAQLITVQLPGGWRNLSRAGRRPTIVDSEAVLQLLEVNLAE